MVIHELILRPQQVSNVELLVGDAIIMGSDGLFDNVFDHEITLTIARHRNVAEAGMCFLKQLTLERLETEPHNTLSN
jgi:protein phosphatase PTC7